MNRRILERAGAGLLILATVAQIKTASSCAKNSNPSSTKDCYTQTQVKTTTDQQGNDGANTFCLKNCTTDCLHCTFTNNDASSGCTQSGQYDVVYKFTSNASSSHTCAVPNSGCTYYDTWTYPTTYTQQNEVAKYIIDNANCPGT